ncbi:MAG TPA: hypothetical protein ENN80_12185, partial [Candidatus Hydrogenedentes bacterium]|nr:hypothetical protein [Candidatus Hydrogenedentota bacterium]
MNRWSSLLFCAALLLALRAGADDEALTRAMGQPYYAEAIVPTPRDVTRADNHILLVDGPARAQHYTLDMRYDGPSAALARHLLAERIADYTKQVDQPLATASTPTPLTIVLASDPWSKAYAAKTDIAQRIADLPEQGYFLDITPKAIVCIGADNEGVVNAVASLLQLLHIVDGRLVAQCARVFDWPTFTTRYTSEYWIPGADFFDWMMTYKINGFALSYRAMLWEGLSDTNRKGLKAIGDYIKRYQSMHFLVEIHVGGREGPPVDCGAPEDVGKLLDTIRETMALSRADHVMICYDDVSPELQPKEKEHFASPAEAHGHLMDQVHRAVNAQDPDAVVSFCTPFYQG